MGRLTHVTILIPILIGASAHGETVCTLTLDGLSFVSFGDRQTLALPAGSTLGFRFGAKAQDGTIPFTIQPGDVSIADVPLATGGVLRYALASGASGRMRPTPEGREIRFTATVRATLETGGPKDGSFEYTIPFTTGAAAAQDRAGTETLRVGGQRLIEGARYTQIVGATTNRANAFPEPGAAVYTVLSGSFDRVP
jgi:hypothetical protein